MSTTMIRAALGALMSVAAACRAGGDDSTTSSSGGPAEAAKSEGITEMAGPDTNAADRLLARDGGPAFVLHSPHEEAPQAGWPGEVAAGGSASQEGSEDVMSASPGGALQADVSSPAEVQRRRSLSASPKMAKRCIRSAAMPLENSSDHYQFVDCPDGGKGLLYAFLTEDWQNTERNLNPGPFYVAYNGSATNGDPSYMVNVAHNWPPYQHVKYPLNYFNWEPHTDGTWRANILTAQYADRLIYSNEPGFDASKQYVANAIQEHSAFGMETPANLDSLYLDARVRLTRTQNPDARVVAVLRWTLPGDTKEYILEYNLWSSDEKHWCTGSSLCGYSNHAGLLNAYIIMGGRAHGLPALSTGPEGTFYHIDWGATVHWLQHTSCAAVGGPDPCLPSASTQPIGVAGAGFMTERRGYGEVGISVAEMDVWVKDPGGTVEVYRTFRDGDHMATRVAAERGYVTEDTYHFYDNPEAAPKGYAVHPVFRCNDAASLDHFVSLDPGCEGRNQEGVLGYLLESDPGDGAHAPLYRCLNVTDQDHFTSRNANCEGHRAEGSLGVMRLTELDTRGAPPIAPAPLPPATVKVYRAYKDHQGGDHMLSQVSGEAGYATEDTYYFYRSAQTSPAGVANHPVFRCLNESGYDHFISHDANCEGHKQEGVLGHLLAEDPRDGVHAPLYRCLNERVQDHFTSRDGNCEGHRLEGRMGFMRAVELSEPVAPPVVVPPPPQDPGSTVPVYRTYRDGKHMATRNAGEGGYATEDTFHFYAQPAPLGRATHAVYRCYNAGARDHFVSHDSNCEGQNQEGLLGFLLASDPGDGQHGPLYRCLNPGARDHFVSRDGNCEGQRAEAHLGFARL